MANKDKSTSGNFLFLTGLSSEEVHGWKFLEVETSNLISEKVIHLI